MRITRIDLDAERRPEKITAELSTDEALYLAAVLARQTSADSNALLKNGAQLGNDIYSELTEVVFDRYWVDGVEGAAAEHGGAPV